MCKSRCALLSCTTTLAKATRLANPRRPFSPNIDALVDVFGV